MIRVFQNTLFALEKLFLKLIKYGVSAVICVFSVYYSQMQKGNTLCYKKKNNK